MKIRSGIVAGLFGAALFSALGTAASAAVVGYVNDPTGNSSDFTTGVNGLGGSVTTLNVGGLSTGALPLNPFPGVTFSATGSGFGTVSTGAGPADGNVGTPPLSSGEGLHAAASYIGPST